MTKTSDLIRQRLKDQNIRHWAGDNISSVLEDGDKQKLIDEATTSFEDVLDSLIIDRDNDPNSHGTAKRLAKMYFNELMYYLTKNDYQIEKLYDHYSASLLNLLKSKNFLISLNDYEIGLLILTGHYIVFDIDSDDKTIDINEKYKYVPDLGPKLSQNIRDTYMGKTMMALSGLHSYDTESVKESRVLMKRLIDYYIQPKKIKTREILRYITL